MESWTQPGKVWLLILCFGSCQRLPTTILCCGNKKEIPAVSDTKALPQKTEMLVTQPGLQPTMEQPVQFNRFSGVSTLPPVHTSTVDTDAAYQQPQMTGNEWEQGTTHSLPRTSGGFDYFNTASSSTPFGSLTYDLSPLRGETLYSSSQLSLPFASPPTSNMSYGQPRGATPPQDQGKMSVAIDFGTTFSGVAYGSTRIAGGRVQQILNWPGSSETFRKIPTCLLYDEKGQVKAWGLEAKKASPMPGTTRCEWFKLFLDPSALRDGSPVDPRLPSLPPHKEAIDVIIDFLSCLWEYAKEQITRDIGAVADLNSAEVWVTVPAAWNARGCDIMRDAAIKAGLVQNSGADDKNWQDRLRIITEPEAAAVHCAKLTDLHRLKRSQNFIVCDAGGGTVDLAVYKIIGHLANLEIAEMCARSGANCGSLFLDLRFRDLVKSLLKDHPEHLEPESLAYFMRSFSETDKHSYRGTIDDETIFLFTCSNPRDPHDPSVGLINGQLAISGAELRRKVFDPVVNEVIQLIEEQIARVDQPIHALLLVGGFAGNEYLKQRVHDQFGSPIRIIARPPDADTATLRGAAAYGLAKKPLVSTIVASRSYFMQVKLPAEKEDWLKRPAYITKNDAGVSICANRLEYLVLKGAILRKGQRLTTKVCKYSESAQDSSFVQTLYTTDCSSQMRYTDEGETTEVCKWTVDLATLPTFKQNAAISQTEGFYTEFEIGLELDNPDVRGILLYNHQEWGRVTFDYQV